MEDCSLSNTPIPGCCTRKAKKFFIGHLQLHPDVCLFSLLQVSYLNSSLFSSTRFAGAQVFRIRGLPQNKLKKQKMLSKAPVMNCTKIYYNLVARQKEYSMLFKRCTFDFQVQHLLKKAALFLDLLCVIFWSLLSSIRRVIRKSIHWFDFSFIGNLLTYSYTKTIQTRKRLIKSPLTTLSRCGLLTDIVEH